jgi:heat-inducible transcriptional repressor
VVSDRLQGDTLEALNERESKILELIVTSYIVSAEPVGSRTLSKLLGNRWSSATIRNVMSDLDEQGFLSKPHVVAGRIPTGKAFRYYVNCLLVPRGLGQNELRVLDALFKHRYAYTEQVMEDASRVLASLGQYAGIVVEPKVNTMCFKEIEFVKLSGQKVLVLFVTSAGMVHSRLVSTDENLSHDLLQGMKQYMDERCEGMPFYALKQEIYEDMRRDKEAFSALMRKVLDALDTIVEREDDREVYIEGTSTIIGVPEFSDIRRLRELFQAFEKKEKLLGLLDRSLEDEGIHIIIGAETGVREMRDVSLITSIYRIGPRNRGILGVMGPVRMDYSRIIPIVDETAKMVTELLSAM